MKFRALFFAILAMVATTSAARATIVTVDFTATVNALGDDFVSTPLQVGDLISGSFTYDSTSIADGANPFGDVFPFMDISLNLADLATFAADPTRGLTIGDNVGGEDIFQLRAGLSDTNGGRVTFDARDSDGDIFGAQTLEELTAFFEAGDISGLEMLLLVVVVIGDGVWGECNGSCGIFADITSLSIEAAPIPLPAGGLLFVGGIAGLAAARKRRAA